MVVADGGFLDHAHVHVETEKCEYGLRTRRTYVEVSDTLGAAIIQASGGPKPWPALTALQAEIVKERERERQAEAVTAARFGIEADRSISRHPL